MTVLITGASGHIGANLVRTLIEKKQVTRCLVHSSTKAIEGLQTEKVNGDIRNLDSLCRAFEGVDTVYHLAANISLTMDGWKHLEETNVTGTHNVVEACLRTGVRRLVHFSSIHAFQREPLIHPVDESNPLVNSVNHPPYDRSKAAGTREVRKGIEKGLDAVIIHPTAVIGPHDYQPSYLGEAILMIANGKLPALVKGGYDFVDVRDVVSGALTAAEKAPTGAAYLLGGQWVSMCDLAALVGELTGVRIGKFVCPLWLAHLGAVYFKGVSKLNGKQPLYTSMSLRALQDNRKINHERATRELGYQPRPFRDTIEDTLRWFRENGQLSLSQKEQPGGETK
jgi:dihydroflavonol-4-reductase